MAEMSKVPVKVSYVMASYNHAAFVGAMIDSVLQQTFTNLELIVVDDGSTDATADVVASYANRFAQVRLIKQENQGVVVARNRGLAEARGEFISFIDSDDLLPADRTERLVAALQTNSAVMLAYGNVDLIDTTGKVVDSFARIHPSIPGDFAAQLFSRYCFVPAASVMLKKSVFDSVGPFQEPGEAADYLKWIEVGLKYEIVRIEGEPLGFWRQHSQNVSQKAGVDRGQQYLRLQQALTEIFQRYASLRERVSEQQYQQRLAHCTFMAGFFFAEARAWSQAKNAFSDSLRRVLSWRAAVGYIMISSWLRVCMPFLCRLVLQAKR
jgi:glycosyltransferase involved in cell wall biosynthesis